MLLNYIFYYAELRLMYFSFQNDLKAQAVLKRSWFALVFLLHIFVGFSWVFLLLLDFLKILRKLWRKKKSSFL